MALNATDIAGLVFRDHISVFPDSIKAFRSNPETGVPVHLPVEAFITGLCNGLVNGLGKLTLLGNGDGEDDTPGTANAVKFIMPNILIAEAFFLADQGWTGEFAPDVAKTFIRLPLEYVQERGRLQMRDSNLLGTGSVTVGPTQNAQIQDILQSILEQELASAFQDTGKFGQGDVPGAPINDTVAEVITGYAAAYAMAVASISATVSYTGTGSGGAVGDITTTGFIV